jgi:hypothetical protein
MSAILQLLKGNVRVAGDPPATDEYAIQGARKPLKE